MKVENKINKILMTLASVLVSGATMVNAKVETAEFGLSLYPNAMQSVQLNNNFEQRQMRAAEMGALLSKHLYQVPGLGI